MKVINNYSQYTWVDQPTGIDYSELVTVPDLVLSMQEIYERYAIRGDITGLANNVRSHTQDDFDLDDPALDFDPEESADILYQSHQLRSRQPSDRSVSEDKPLNAGSEDQPKDDPTKPQSNAGDDLESTL